jgi:hypothetical protein
MWWISVAAGAASGAFAVLLASFVFGSGPKSVHSAGKTHRFIYLVVFALTWSITNQFIVPQLQLTYAADSLDEAFAAHPAFAALKKYEPQTYAEMLAQGKKDLKAGLEMPVIQSNGRRHLSTLIEKRMPVADDRAVAGYMKVMVAEMRELHAAGDAACYTFLFPESGPPFNLVTRIQSQTRNADGAALARVIETAATAPQQKVSLESVQPQLMPVAVEVQGKHGPKAFDLLNTMQSTPEDKRKVCEVTIDLYAGILKADAASAGRVIRAMLANGG